MEQGQSLCTDEQPSFRVEWRCHALVSPSVRSTDCNPLMLPFVPSFNGVQAFTHTGLQLRNGPAVTAGGLYFSYVYIRKMLRPFRVRLRLSLGRSSEEVIRHGQRPRSCIATIATSRCGPAEAALRLTPRQERAAHPQLQLLRLQTDYQT